MQEVDVSTPTGTLDLDRLYPLREARPYLGNPCLNTLYKMIAEGRLEALKNGRSTIVTGRSIKAAQEALPRLVLK